MDKTSKKKNIWDFKKLSEEQQEEIAMKDYKFYQKLLENEIKYKF